MPYKYNGKVAIINSDIHIRLSHSESVNQGPCIHIHHVKFGPQKMIKLDKENFAKKVNTCVF